MRSTITPHDHPCVWCGTKIPCSGDLEENYDGWPEAICRDYHQRNGDPNPEFICEDCKKEHEQRRLEDEKENVPEGDEVQ